jgi:hypothetical protein
MEALMPLLFVGVIVLVCVGAYFSWQAEKKRRAELAAYAASKGWDYSQDDPHGLDHRWDVHPFGKGHSREASNVFTGTADGGYPMVAFDYQYKETTTDSKGNSHTSTYRFGVCVLRMPCAMPGLCVGKENVFTRIGSAIGFDDIEFESDEFNRAFRVKADDAKFASDVLHPRTMELLLANGRDIEWRTVGYDMLSWHSGKLTIPDLLERTSLMCRILQGIPGFVWKDLGHDPGNQTRTEGEAR